MNSRQPIVAILGHVDHGKTTLLDYIKSTHRADREIGGITQSIGAYQAEFKGRKLTFIDTPGHAAFSKMRSHGAAVADLAVLVVDAGDGVKPQTLESIKHIKSAAIPFIVAINKIDKPGVTPDLVKAELTQAEVFVEGYGGNTPVVPISGKTGQGVGDLLENLLLLADLEELKYEESGPLLAPIIEAKKDMKRGVSVSAIVKLGTLKVGDDIYTPTSSGKVRALYNDLGMSVKELKPGEPVQILGFSELPLVGEVISHQKPAQGQITSGVVTASVPDKQINIILRADTLGSLEAIKSSLTAEINLVSEGTGDISEGDILLGGSTGSLVLGFSVKANSSVLKLAETDKVTVKTYRIIYELLEYLEKKVMRLLEPTIDEEELGKATILKIFEINQNFIAGCRIESGKISRGDTVHVLHLGVTKEARVKSIRIGKEELTSVEAGKECGLQLFPNLDMGEKDVIISYKKIKTDED